MRATLTLRRTVGLLHRWIGLSVAGFLIVAGLTGAIIAWNHELDAWLNPAFYHATSTAPAKPALALLQEIEAADPHVRVSYLPLALAPGTALIASVEPRVDPVSRKPFDVDYNEIALDPANGTIQGKRMWGAFSLSRENLLPFLYKLHYSLHIPDAGGYPLGSWLMGFVAMAWVIDCFVALWLAFPRWRSWRKSLAFRWREGGHKLNFDAHRSGGVWVWLLLLMIAVTAVSMNLQNEIVRPLVSVFSELSPSPFEATPSRSADDSATPAIDPARIIESARRDARARGIEQSPGGLSYSRESALYGVGFFAAGAEHGDGGLGNPWFYYDASDGSPRGSVIPGSGSAGDIFMQAQYPLHSGRIIGVTGRVLMSVLGLIVATLSITGVVIWARKRRARRASQSMLVASRFAEDEQALLYRQH